VKKQYREFQAARFVFWWLNETLEAYEARKELSSIGNYAEQPLTKPVADIAGQAEQLWAEREELA